MATALLATACGPRQAVVDPTPPEQAIDLETELVLRRDGEVVSIKPIELFDQASLALAAERYEECARDFDVLWRALPGTSYRVPSLYNAGLCHERLESWEDAAERYLLLISEAGTTRDGLDAQFRLAEVDANSSTWTRVAQTMKTVLSRQDLRQSDTLEARYRLGMALVALGDLNGAEREFTTGQRDNRAAGRARLPDGNYFVSGCSYGLALVYHGRFGRIRFRLPEERMKADMETKKELAREAYSHYIRTIHKKSHHWSILSGYMVGKLFEDFYYDILSAEVPTNLTEEEVQNYFLALREELDPLLERALEAYEKTSQVSARIGFKSEWVTITEERMARLERYRKDDEAFEREKEAIIDFHRRRLEVEQGREHEPTAEELLVPPPALELPLAKAAAPE